MRRRRFRPCASGRRQEDQDARSYQQGAKRGRAAAHARCRQEHNRALESQIAAKDSEIALLKSVGSTGGEGGEGRTRWWNERGLDKSDRAKPRWPRGWTSSKQVEDLEAEHEEQVDALKSDIDKNRELLKAKDSELDDATLKLKSLAEGAGGGGARASRQPLWRAWRAN